MLREYLILFFLVLGAVFILVASIGLLRMPDVYLRMAASTIAATFGVSCMLIAVALHFATISMCLHVVGVIIFLVLTVPVGAHMMGRASHIIGLPQWYKTIRDDLKGKYNPETHGFKSKDENNDKDQKEKNSLDNNNSKIC